MVKNPLASVETQVSSLISEDPTGHGATKPVYYSYCAPESGSPNH